MSYFRASVLLSLFLAFASVVQALKSVTRHGRYLYTDAGTNRFYIKGIAYQPQGAVGTLVDNPFQEPTEFIDPLANSTGCRRDLPFLTQLSVNVIRVYSVNSSLNHDDCMNLLSQAGIYTIIDLSLPLNGSIHREDPTWTSNLLDQYITTIDVFSKYDNVLAYNIGNEVITSNATGAAPFIKAAARDTKAYLLSKGSTALVGYAAIDGASDFIVPVADYLSCDPSSSNSNSTSIDLYGLNVYRWCGVSTFQAAYAGTVSQFAQYNVVTYFGEFGCITSPPRLWTEVVAMFSTDMSSWSGGIAFSYFPAASAQGQFGMVTISADGSTVTTTDDFDELQKQYSNVSLINSPLESAVGQPTYSSCPTNNTSFVASPSLPPTPNRAACSCLENNLSCQFAPVTTNVSTIVGELLNTACSLLGGRGGTCNDISSDGTTGVYGLVSSCDPSTKLSYVMSQFYENTGNNAQSCNFAGNATLLHPGATPTVSASTVASSCLANSNAVFTPSAPATSGSSSPTSTSEKSSSVSLNLSDAMVGMSVMAIVAVMSAVWTLA